MKSRFLSQGASSRSGIVLLELVTALGIFTLVAFSMVLALNAAFEAGRARNEIDAATRGLNNQLALLHATRPSPIDKDIPDDGTGIKYHVTIAPEQLKDQKGQIVGGIYRATITAKWVSSGQEESRSVSELIYQP